MAKKKKKENVKIILPAHKLYIKTFGCQMNSNDSQIVESIMLNAGYTIVDEIKKADIIFLNTCSVRDNAEETIHNQIKDIYGKIKNRPHKTIIGILGCMAERLGEKMLLYTNVVSLVVGPDEYRKLPELVNLAFEGENSVAIDLNSSENYDDIIPIRNNEISAWLTIMRGCNNFCSYCIVPYVRGRERSKSIDTILAEVDLLSLQGIKEITLLGQNVNSYSYGEEDNINFPKLLSAVAERVKDVRIRFLTSHPRNMSSELIDTISKYDNICNYIHLPVQSGSNRILEKMNRKYTVEYYLSLIDEIKNKIKDVAISTDIIAGYPTETIEDHQATLELIKKVRYSNAFMFRYSPREGTKVFKEIDDVSEEEKIRRLNEIINLQNQISAEENNKEIGNIHEVLIEKCKEKRNQFSGKTKTFKNTAFHMNNKYKIGNLVKIKIYKTTSATLIGKIVE